MPELYEPARRASRGLLLFALPLPLLPAVVLSLLKGDVRTLLAELAALALLGTGAWLTRDALKSEAKRRRLPRAGDATLKLAGAAALVAGTFVTSAFVANLSLAFAIVISALAALGYWLAYAKTSPADAPLAPGATGERVAATLDEAEAHIAKLEAAARGIRDTALADQIRRVASGARVIIGKIEQDPRDLRRARKFFNVYLDGAARVAEGYARMSDAGADATLDTNFRTVLTRLEHAFAEQHERLLEDDVVDLDVQIEVLTKRLEHEGVI